MAQKKNKTAKSVTAHVPVLHQKAEKERQQSKHKLKAIIEPKDDIGKLKLSSIIDCEELQSMMEEFNRLTGLTFAIIDLSGSILVSAGWQDICTQFHRCHPETHANCVESDTILSRGVREGNFKIYRCKNNLQDMATPIMVGGKHVGNFFIGQFFYEDEIPDAELFRDQARRYGFNEQDYLAAFVRVPRLSREKTASAMNFYSRLAAMVAAQGYKTIQLARTLHEREQAEQALIEREKQYRELVETANSIILRWKPDGTITFFNQFAENFFGFSKQELLGKSVLGTIVPERDSQNRDLNEMLQDMAINPDSYTCNENENILKDGSRVWISWMNKATLNKEDRVSEILSIGQDITERKKAEDLLRESEDSYRRQFSNNFAVMLLISPEDGQILDANSAARDFYGYSREHLTAMTIFDLNTLPPEVVRKKIASIANDQGSRFEFQHRMADGSVRDVEVFSSRILLNQRQVLHSIIVDITDRNQTEEALQKTQFMLAEAQRIAAMGSWDYDVETDTAVWSDNLFRVCDVDPANPLALKFNYFISHVAHPDDRKHIQNVFKRALEGLQPYDLEYRIVHRNGSIRVIHALAETLYDEDGRAVRMIGLAQDITERKRSEDALRESELHFRLLFEGSRDGFVSVDEHGRFIDANEAYCRMLGYSIDELRSMKDFYRITPEKWHKWEREEIWQNQLLKNGFTGVYEKEYIRKDGTVFPAELQAYAVHDEEQHIDYFWGVARDITERKKADAERQRYEWILEKQLPPGTTDADEAQPCYGDVTKYNTRRVILDGIGKKNLAVMAADVMALLNTSLAVYEANGDYAYGVFKSSWCQFMDNAAYKRCGLDNARDALGCGKWLCHENCWHNSARAAIETGKATDIECVGGINLYAEPIVSDSEIIGVVNIGYGNPPQDDDSLRQLAEKFNVSLELLREKSATYKPRPDFIIELGKKRCKYMAEMIGGIIERKKIEQTLQAKNEELIRFNYTISHDLKAPLVTIKTFLGYLEQKLETGDTQNTDEDMIYIHGAADKMNALLDDLLNLGRVGRVNSPPVEAPLQEIVHEALDLVAGSISERKVQVTITKKNCMLYGDRVRLVEVFQNLLDNAVRFMGDQGKPAIEVGTLEKDGEIRYCVRDNGIGIDPRHIHKVFGLFERLNPAIEGTGIGLALVKRIVEVHGGRVWVESEGVGRGACFWFTLPGKSEE